MKTETQYYYVHGLHSSRNAVKFQEILLNFPNAVCLEWTIDDNLDNKIIDWISILKKSQYNNVLMGSSTGCNFICQMDKILELSNIYPKTILLNPLINLNQVINEEIIPVQLKKSIQEIDHFHNYLLIISDSDKVLDHRFIPTKILQSNQIIISKDDNHQLLKFKNYLTEIKRFTTMI